MESARSSGNKGVEILIAEDSPTQAEQLKYLLEKHGFSVTVAANGEQALMAARKLKPALILSDIVMPGMDGFTLSRHIKSDDGLGDTPVVLVTSLTSPQDILKGLECGADNFITKPYDETYLLSRIEHILMDRALPKPEKVRFGAEVFFAGRRQFIAAERQQVLSLLLSTYEDAVRINDELEARGKWIERSYQLLKTLYRLAEGLNAATTEKEVLENVLERAMELPGVQAGWISLWKAEAGFSLAGARGLPPALDLACAWDGDCLCRQKALAGELEGATNILECERLQKAKGDTRGLRCHASVLLRSGEQMVGILNLAGPESGLFREEDLETLRSVGNEIAVALQRARLCEQLETKVEERTAALVQSEATYRSLVDGAPQAIFRATVEGSLLTVNPAMLQMLGYSSADELLSKNLATDIYCDPNERIRLMERYPKGISGVEAEWKRKDGSPLWVRLSGKPAYSSSGVIAHYEVIAEDVTKRRVLEERLRQSQKLEAIGQLAGGVAHDFNNLLGVIIGYGDLLLEQLEPNSPQCKKVQEIRKAAQSAVSITHQLLAFSRKQVLEPKVLDLNAVVSDSSRMLRRLIGEDIDLAVSPAPDLGKVRADRGQIEQVIMNLAVNARDAMPRGGKLHIETANTELEESYTARHPPVQPGSYVMLAVSDTGVGMDVQTQARVFEPFFTTKEKGKGTGLGLATVYGIVKQSGGYIWVYSEPNTGATFKIYLPRVEAEAEAAGREVASEEPAQGTETVLLVEDDEALRSVTRVFLDGYGYRVLEAKDGAEAMQVANRHRVPIHLLLADVVMPGISGPELAERLTARYPTMKVLYMSGYTYDAMNHRGALKEGMVLLQKPFTRQLLARKLREVLDLQRLRT